MSGTETGFFYNLQLHTVEGCYMSNTSGCGNHLIDMLIQGINLNLNTKVRYSWPSHNTLSDVTRKVHCYTASIKMIIHSGGSIFSPSNTSHYSQLWFHQRCLLMSAIIMKVTVVILMAFHWLVCISKLICKSWAHSRPFLLQSSHSSSDRCTNNEHVVLVYLSC